MHTKKVKILTHITNGETMEIKRHKVFISYYHQEDQWFKNRLLQANDDYNLFEDCSVHEKEIEDDDLLPETIRKIIRDDYMQEATVLILLCGQTTKHRKHIDWEIHTAMFHTEKNPKMGILVINLPTVEQTERSTGDYEKQFFSPTVTWSPASKKREDIEALYPHLPVRIIDNLIKDDVSISIVNWNTIEQNFNRLKGLVDVAFDRRTSNNYDHSRPLRRKNS